MVRDASDREFSGEESLLYGREKDCGKRADASFGWLSPAEGVRLFKFVEQGGFYGGMCAWVH